MAEDVDINREILVSLLEDTGVEVYIAENGREAADMLARSPGRYGLIFMDVQMPVMDGIEATRRIRSRPFPAAKTVPIIAMTANVFRGDVEKCIGAGMDGHLGKPLDIDEVLAVMRKYL